MANLEADSALASTAITADAIANLRTNFRALQSDLSILQGAFDESIPSNHTLYQDAGDLDAKSFFTIERSVSRLLKRIQGGRSPSGGEETQFMALEKQFCAMREDVRVLRLKLEGPAYFQYPAKSKFRVIGNQPREGNGTGATALKIPKGSSRRSAQADAEIAAMQVEIEQMRELELDIYRRNDKAFEKLRKTLLRVSEGENSKLVEGFFKNGQEAILQSSADDDLHFSGQENDLTSAERFFSPSPNTEGGEDTVAVNEEALTEKADTS
ncbi:unnamed protein product [Sphagnum balticum]